MRVTRYTLKKYKYFPHTFFRVVYSSFILDVKLHQILLHHWKGNYIIDITLKNILSTFLSNQLTLSSISSKEGNSSYASLYGKR